MAVVETIHDGETTIIFHDDFCKNTTQEEIDAALKRIARRMLPSMREAEAKKSKDKTG